MDRFGLVDYLKPGIAGNDYRTSMYRGHRYLNYHTEVPRMRCPVASLNYSDIPCMEPARKTEQQDQFHWNPSGSQPARTSSHKNIKYMKTFNETHLRHPPNPLKTLSSTYGRDFLWQPQAFEEKVPKPYVPPIVEFATTPFLTNRCAQNHGKLLHPSATTNNLTYPPYTKQAITISLKDNITFWNWDERRKDIFKVKQTFCDPFKTKRYNEYNCPVNHVPNSGLTTTTKSDYVQTLDYLDFDITHKRNNSIMVPDMPSQMETENAMYGSGKRIQKYIDTGRLIF